jgi:hypothetical protein
MDAEFVGVTGQPHGSHRVNPLGIVFGLNGDTNPRGPGYIDKPVNAAVNGTYTGRKQIIHGGSYASQLT